MKLPRVLRNRDYRLAWTGVFVSNIGTWMETIGVTTYVTRVTGQAKWTALVAALLFVPAIVLGPIGGALADRFDRRWYLGIMTVAQMLLALLLMVLAFTHHLSVPVVAVVMGLTGCAASLVGPAFSALIVDFVPAEDVVGAVNLNSAQFNLARIVGPALAAPIIGYASLGWAFTLNTLSFLAVIVALLRVRMPAHEPSVSHEPLGAGIRSGLRAAQRDDGLWTALTLTLLASFLVSPFIGLSSVFVMHVMGRDEAAASLLVVAQGMGAILFAVAVVPLTERFGRTRVLGAACGLLGPVAILYWLAPSYGFACLMVACLGAMHLGTVTGCNSVCQTRAPRGMRARVGSLFSLVVALGYAPGLPVLGVLGDVWGLRRVAVGGALLFTAIVATWRLREKLLFRRLDAPLRLLSSTENPVSGVSTDIEPSASLEGLEGP